MINKAILVGRLTKDVELRKTPNGASVVQFTLAVGRRIKKEGQAEADFINCVAWNKTAELMAQYLQKGAQIGIEGRIQTRKYDDKDGKTVYITEVWCDSLTFLETNRNNAQAQNNNEHVYNDTQYTSFADTIDVTSDDLPF